VKEKQLELLKDDEEIKTKKFGKTSNGT